MSVHHLPTHPPPAACARPATAFAPQHSLRVRLASAIRAPVARLSSGRVALPTRRLVPSDHSNSLTHLVLASVSSRGVLHVTAASKIFLPFEQARKLVREVALTSKEGWVQWCSAGNRPKDVPSHPEKIYQNEGWASWADWLGYGEGKPQRARVSFLPFEQARALVRLQGFSMAAQFWAWDRPVDVPSNPSQAYADKGWVSFNDWLGKQPTRVFLPFEEARELVRKQQFQTHGEWKAWDRPVDVPSNPNIAYVDKGWAGWDDWLGRKR